jgi:hypothetical protein
MTFLLYLALTAPLPNCTTPVLDNQTSTWTAVDLQSYNGAVQRCFTKYPNSPCLKVFRKLEQGRYQAICGGKK